MNKNKEKIKAEKRRRNKNRAHQCWKSETQETKGKVRKKAPKTGRAGGREGDRLRLGTLRGQSPLSTWRVSLFALIKCWLFSVITCSLLPFRKLVGKGRYDMKWQWPKANTNLLERITYSSAPSGSILDVFCLYMRSTGFWNINKIQSHSCVPFKDTTLYLIL